MTCEAHSDRVRFMILARALYDPAITADMSNEQTEKLIPEIIHRLVVGVKVRGEEALYQR